MNILKGKSLFCHRLGNELLKQGVEVTDDESKRVDISLNVIRLTHQNSRIKVLRLDGIYHNSAQDYESKNRRIKESLHKADAVVYQSRYSRNLCDAFIGAATVPNIVIPNGSDPSFYEKKVHHPSQKEVLAFAKWRPHKRLHDTISSFMAADVRESSLFVFGETTLCNKYENIYFRGQRSQDMLAVYLQSADCVLHLCAYDACPNSVVESLVAGTPVITSNIGGAPELLKMVGLSDCICDLDPEYDYKPINLYNLPPINHEIVAQKIRQVISSPPTFDPSPLYIENTAKRYLRFFEGLLK